MRTAPSKSPYSFQVFESSGGARIFRIPMKVFPDLWAYAYLVLVDEYIVLIDTYFKIMSS